MSFAGQLDKTINILDEVSGISDGMGGTLPATWKVIYRRIKAAIVLISKEGQILTYDKKTAFANFYWYLEYLSGITEGKRVDWSGRIFEIRLVLPWQEKERFMKLACIEVGRST